MKCCCGAVDDDPPPRPPVEFVDVNIVSTCVRDHAPLDVMQPPPPLDLPVQNVAVQQQDDDDAGIVVPVIEPVVQLEQPPPSFLIDNQYSAGMVPGTDGDISLFVDNTLSGDDVQCFQMSQAVVGQARQLLPHGPLNNRLGLPPNVRDSLVSPAYSNALNEGIAQLGFEQLKAAYPDEPDMKLALVARAEAVKRVGAGVCAMIASLCTTLLSSTALPGTEVCQVFQGPPTNHEFVIIRYNGSRWFVVDPWPVNAYSVPFVDCYFGPQGVTNYLSVTVQQPSPDQPFGIDPSVVDWATVEQQARDGLDPESPQFGQMEHNFNHQSNVLDPGQWPDEWKGGGENAWG